MPLFYFHLYDDLVSLDEERRDLDDAYTAHQQAVREAREMAAESVRNGRLALWHCVRVTDDSRAVLFTVKFEDVVAVSFEEES